MLSGAARLRRLMRKTLGLRKHTSSSHSAREQVKLIDDRLADTYDYPNYHSYYDRKGTGNMLRICHSYAGEQLSLPRERFVLRPSVYAIIRNEHTVLLVTNTTSGRYYLPGGGLEIGESLEEALHREVREEAGIAVIITRLITAVEDFFYYDPADTAYHALQFYYQASACSMQLSTTYQVDNGEDNPQWVPIAALHPHQFHNHGERLYRLITAHHAE